MWVANVRNAKNGSIVSRVSPASSSVRLSASTIRFCWRSGIRFVSPSVGSRHSLPHSASQNRMKESLILFESVINSRWFLRTSIILFLNKIDVFKNKLPKVRDPPSISFPVPYVQTRFRWSGISPNILVAMISTKLRSMSSGDSCKQTEPGSAFTRSRCLFLFSAD